jgi:preprotein translocase subunit SecG
VLLAIQVLVSAALIVFILLQHGRGADAGAAFGSGASATVFGARGSGNFFTRATSILAFVFVANSLALAWIAKERMLARGGSLMEGVAPPAVQAPAELPAQKAEPAAPPAQPASDVPEAPEGN